MAAVTDQVLHHDIRAVRLEAHTIVSVINMTVLNHHVATPIRIPAIRILCVVFTGTLPGNTYIAEHHIGAIRYEIVPLWGIAQIEIGDGSAMQTDGAEEDRAQGVDVGGV